MTNLINNLFPGNQLEASMKIINMKKSIENSIPNYLLQHNFIKIKSEKGGYYFINYIRNIFLYYLKKDFANTEKSKIKKQQVVNDLCEMNKNNPNYELIYGCLFSEIEGQSQIVVNNVTINVISGEQLLHDLFKESFNLVHENMRSKVNELFE